MLVSAMPEIPGHIPLPVLVGLFAVAMAVLAMLRGILRLILSVLKLALGVAAGAFVFLKAPEWLGSTVPNPSATMLGGMSLLGGAAGHFSSGFILEKLLGGMESTGATGESLSKSKIALLSLVPSSLLMWAGGVLLRLTGSLSGIAQLDHGTTATPPAWLTQTRAALSQGVVGRAFNFLDPVTSPEVVRLCEILVTYRDPVRWKSVKNDPSMQLVVHQPAFQRLLDDREVKFAVGHSNYARLFTLPEVRDAATDPALASALQSVHQPEVRRAEPVT